MAFKITGTVFFVLVAINRLGIYTINPLIIGTVAGICALALWVGK